MEVIGFATEFYTLWNKVVTRTYFTDAYGNHHYQGDNINYYYVKNISTDLAKVKELFPNTPIDNDLKGQSRDFSITTPDACPEILKFGKYCGKHISEVASIDFDYIIWILSNGRKSTIDACLELQVVKDYVNKQKEHELAIEENINSQIGLESGLHTLLFTTNPNRHISECYEFKLNYEAAGLSNKYYAVAIPKKGSEVYVMMDVKKVDGMYPYNMGIINGKAKKVKNKEVAVNIEILETFKYVNGTRQLAVLK